MKNRSLVVAMLLSATSAFAQGADPAAPQPAPQPQPGQQQPPPPQPMPTNAPMPTTDPRLSPYANPYAPQPMDQGQPPPPPPEKKKKEPGRGDFDAGGQMRLPNGPNEDFSKYESFNWIAADLKGRYFLLDQVTLNGNIPLAVKKPDMLTKTDEMGTVVSSEDPRMIGGMSIRLDAKMQAPKMPGMKYDTEIGLSLTGAYMRSGAMYLSEKDYPKFVGDFKPGFAGGLITKVKLGSVVDFSLVPTWVTQAETGGAIQVPMALIIKAGDLIKLSLDLGVYTGPDYSGRAKNGGRIGTGAALDVKIGPILAHLGAGVASLITDPQGLYPSIGESVYFDINAKYAK